MAKISNKPLNIPTGVTVTLTDGLIKISGPKGELQVTLLPKVNALVKDQEITVTPADKEAQTKAFAGLIKALLRNSFIGVTTGYIKTLKLVGTGYRVTAQGKGISLAVGFSHPVEITAPEGIELKVEGQDTIKIIGYDKQAVGQIAANIRKVRPPEPYKGKGIRYEDEVVRRKQGKSAAK
jgi:large subunit ribosomal protein L6